MAKTKRRFFFYVLLFLTAAGLLGAGGFWWHRRGIKVVQTALVQRRDITAVVTASGEVRPRDYVHITASAFGRITGIHVKEGDRVRKGQLLAELEAIQPAADVRAQEAELAATERDREGMEASVHSAEANVKTADASLARVRAQLDRAQADFERARSLHEEQLISRASFEQTQAEHAVAVAAVEEAEARRAQAQAQLNQARAQSRIAQERIERARAALDRARDLLTKHTFVAPITGVVTDLPVSEGENLVVGIQNAPGSLLMTIADLSVITTEVMVDETDIGAVRMGQTAQVRVDAFPDRPFTGQVTEIGNTAVIRSTGLAAAQSAISSQQAKDFKVVITLANPDESLRPGLSATADVTTATRTNVVTIPLQALTVRRRRDLEPPREGVTQAADLPSGAAATPTDGEEELEGVFVVRNDRALFQRVETGLSGLTDIEVVSGLAQGAEIVTGSYEVLRNLQSGERVRVDNAPPRPAGGFF
jgi:HlyD family secretion protein